MSPSCRPFILNDIIWHYVEKRNLLSEKNTPKNPTIKHSLSSERVDCTGEMKLATTAKCLAIWLALPALAAAETHVFNYTAGYVDVNPDGLYEKKEIGFNGQWPLPEIHVNKGDRVVLYLTNGLENKNTSLHFHGMFMRGENWSDGPEMMTQCPIGPGQTFLYNFTVGNQVGTYWYHAHTGAQYGDGLRAAFVVHDPDAPFQYDHDTVITLSDHYHLQYDDITKKFLNRFNPTGAEPIPQSLLLNDGANVTMKFDQDKTYLIRLVNIGLFTSQYFQIEDHELEVVEVDGVYVEPFKTDLIYIAVGQRYSVLVRTKSKPSKNYAIAQRIDDTMLDVVPPELRMNYVSYMVYDDNKPLPSQDYQIGNLDSALEEFNLTTLHKTPLFDDYDYQITLDVVMDNLDDGINYAFFNNLTYVQPKVPTLLTVLSSGDNATHGEIYGSNTNSFVLQKDEIVEIVVNNMDNGKHPFHLHGHNFQVIQKSPEFDEITPYNEHDHPEFPKHPVVRDTVTLQGNGYIVIRFKADNPGVWFFHCHVDWHLEQGLAIVLVEDPLAIQKQPAPPAEYFQVCKNLGVPTEGNAAGNSKDFFDLTGENRQPNQLPAGFTTKGYIALLVSTLVALYGVYSIIQFGLEDSTEDDLKIFSDLKTILTEHGLLDEQPPHEPITTVDERTRLADNLPVN